jgi:cellulose synthase/poly-beta-1,6-N-acetylglucosamine synthase-like glycosyltransferase
MNAILASLDALSTVLLVLMLGVAVFNLFTMPRLERFEGATPRAPVSLLIPARDEAIVLAANLPQLSDIGDDLLEILVLNDGSRDQTAEVVRRAAGDDPRIRLVDGEPLPAGWLGKNWGCWQLAAAARSEYLVFCDADVAVAAGALDATVNLLAAHDDVVTALPRQRSTSLSARVVVPFFTQLPIFLLLPVALVRRLRSSAISAGNGQWLAFRRSTYAAIGGHAAIRSEVVEDVALVRLAKRHGARARVVLAQSSLAAWTYASWEEVEEGFAKNAFRLVGGRAGGFAAAVAIFYLATLHPFLAALAGGNHLPLLLLLSLRVAGAALFHHGPAAVLLHPVGALLALWIGGLSAWRSWTGTLSWRGRSLPPGSGRAVFERRSTNADGHAPEDATVEWAPPPWRSAPSGESPGQPEPGFVDQRPEVSRRPESDE